MSLYVNSKMRARSICVAFATDAVGGSAPYSGGAFPSAELLYTTTATTEKRSIDKSFSGNNNHNNGSTERKRGEEKTLILPPLFQIPRHKRRKAEKRMESFH
jgi:hypothetical protein